jgi:HAD superfamily hydrolase (TIGR01458 family)
MNLHVRRKALLVDLDGVIHVQEQLVPGALDAIRFLQDRRIPHRFVTNTSTHSRRQLLARLSIAGIQITESHLFTAPMAAAQYLRSMTDAQCYFYTTADVLEDFVEIAVTRTNPTHVVIGDVGEDFSYNRMNEVFRMIMGGAELVALQKNRYWMTRDGLKLDAGAYVSALEYATGKTARVFGKPSPDFFTQACDSLGLPPSNVAMIGDDLQADIAGGHEAHLYTIFVRTGKDRDTTLSTARVQPDLTLNSIAELPGLLTRR